MAGLTNTFRVFHVGCLESARVKTALKKRDAVKLAIVPLFDVPAGFSEEVRFLYQTIWLLSNRARHAPCHGRPRLLVASACHSWHYRALVCDPTSDVPE
jgi:hypothetical protein